MITEDYVSFETAKLLKEKGFDEATNRYYNAQYDQIRTVSDTFLWHWNNEEFMKGVLMDGAIAIPTLQMAMKWLRIEHNLAISISVTVDGWYSYVSRIKLDSEGFVVDIIDGIDSGNIPNYDTYEKSCEAAIKYCLENLI